MKRVKSVLKTLLDHGVVFYGVMVVLVVTALVSYGVIQKKHAEAAMVSGIPSIDMTSAKLSNSTELTLSYIASYTIPTDYDAAESMAIDENGYFYITILPKGDNLDNSKVNLLRVFHLNSSGGLDWDRNYSFNLGHGNGATYDSARNEVLIATSLTGNDAKKGEIVRIGVTSGGVPSLTGTFYQTDSTGAKRVATAIAYNDLQNRLYAYRNDKNATYNGKISSLDAKNRTMTNYIQEKHSPNLVNQDMGYYNGYLYRLTQDKDGSAGFGQNYGVIFQLSGWYGGASDTFYKTYHTTNGCEIESLSVYNNTPYILFNNCSWGTPTSGAANRAFTVAKVTKVGGSTDLNKFLYHKYKINYNTNGGSWASGSSTSIVKDAYAGVPQNIISDKPTKSNKYFLGWSTSATATTASYQSGEEYLKNYGGADSDVTLYAVYEDYYTVSYNANGGSGAPSAQTQRKSLNVSIPTTKPTRTYYAFKGWATSSGGSVAYNPGDIYTNHTNVTLYAVWAPIQYKVTYYPNGGSGSSWSTAFNAADSVAISMTKPTRTYYAFKGWATSASSTAIAYTGNGGETFSGHTNLDLYAVWEVQYYTISFNPNGGSGAPSAIRKPKTESPITLPKNTPTRSGFTFKGWATSSTGAVAYAPSASYSGRSDATLYAVWEEIVTPPTDVVYYLSFDANGGDGGPDTVEVANSTQATIPTGGEPTRDGYSFSGWSENSSGSGTLYHAGDTIGVNGDKMLYAAWVVDKIWVDYDANGGSGAPERHGGTVGAITISTTVPTRSGYTFDGWAVRGGSSVEYRPGQSYLGDRSISLVAIWSENTIGVDFDQKGGNVGPRRISAAPYHSVTIPNVVPNRNGYGFLGWSILSAGLIVDYDPGDEIELEDSEITLYAVWSENQYVVSFDANGGVGAPESMSGAGYRFVIPQANLGRVGYLFIGWNRDRNATAPEFVAGDIYTDGADITLYAVWKEDEPEATGGDASEDDGEESSEGEESHDDEPEEAPEGSEAPNTPNTEATNIFGLSVILVMALICSGLLVLKEKARRR